MGRPLRAATFIGLSLLWCSVAAPGEAGAEWYVAAQAGAQVPQDLSNIHGTGSFTGVTSNDLNLRNQFAYVKEKRGRESFLNRNTCLLLNKKGVRNVFPL